MKYQTLFIVSLIAVVILCAFACKSKKINPLENMHLIFGNSGGFAGKVTKYKLDYDGSLSEFNQDSEDFSFKTTLDKKLTKQFFNNFTDLQFNDLDIDDPGNMTYFIIVGEGERKKILRWGGSNVPVPDNLETYYKTFMKLAKSEIDQKVAQ